LEFFWNCLSCNPNAIPILEKNLDKVDWNWLLSSNPNALHLLFEYDYEGMKKHREPIFKDLCEYVFNPKRIIRFCKLYNIEFDEYMEII